VPGKKEIGKRARRPFGYAAGKGVAQMVGYGVKEEGKGTHKFGRVRVKVKGGRERRRV